ncbi:histidine phosphatase family protein [uncultured Roseovarius sp.]|uniref:histidine phosphatase family protein n=1 Tax=Roseovarius pacificus TaxID=337701 RepID=UPI00259A9E0D|nr:histidine phosphatase family protein [uncultured Roseovarius sp.]
MNPSPDVYLLRHGETVWNKAGRIQGQMNSDLTDLGREQAKTQAGILKRLEIGLDDIGLFCSPLTRTRETAALALEGRDCTIDDRLIEIGCGAWEGLTPAERATRDPEIVARCKTDLDLYFNAPGNEGLPAVQARIAAFLADLTGPAVIVSHKVALIVMRGLLTGLPDDRLSELTSRQGTVIHISGGQERHYE